MGPPDIKKTNINCMQFGPVGSNQASQKTWRDLIVTTIEEIGRIKST